MTTMNGVPFRQMMVSTSKRSIKCPNPMVPKKITVHETDNMTTAENEVKYMIGNDSSTSYHTAIDETEVIQALPYNRNGWHSGDGKNGYGNRNTIGVEICRNYDRNRQTRNLIEPLKSQYNKAKENAVKVIAQLCVDHNIVANSSNIKRHYDWNRKNCPSKMIADKLWNAFLNDIIAEYNRLVGKKATSSSKPANNTSKDNSSSSNSSTKSKWTKIEGKWTGQSLFEGQYGPPVEDMQTMLANNTPPFYPEKGAKNNGVDNYFGGQTKDAVIRFQTYYGLKVDGIPGKEVYGKLKENKSDSSSESGSSSKSSSPSFKVNSKVTLSKSAKKYATGQTIPSSVKGKSYTIQQIKTDRVLLKEIVSWVYKKDVVGTSSSSSKSKTSTSNSSSNSSESGKHGKLKIVNVNSAAIVMDKPDRNNAKSIGTIKKGATLPLNGSVRGKNSDNGYWEVEYKGGLGYITGNFGQKS